jgi:hypothetical protein
LRFLAFAAPDSHLRNISRFIPLVALTAKWQNHFQPLLIKVAARTTTETLVERSVSRSRLN